MVKAYKMWALFNYDRPPIFIQLTRRECVLKGSEWLGKDFAKSRRNGSVTIEKVKVFRTLST